MMKRALTPLIFVVEDIYSCEECSDWIAFSEMHVYDAAPIAQVVIAPEVRNNTRSCWMTQRAQQRDSSG